MARSLKKGPYIAHHLDKKVQKMNEGKKRRQLKPGRALQ